MQQPQLNSGCVSVLRGGHKTASCHSTHMRDFVLLGWSASKPGGRPRANSATRIIMAAVRPHTQ